LDLLKKYCSRIIIIIIINLTANGLSSGGSEGTREKNRKVKG
jgi:hypothetical protein